MAKKFKGEVYLVTNLAVNKKYVGVTARGYLNRWKKHLAQAKTKGTGLHAAIHEFGESNFKIELLESKEYVNQDRLAMWLYKRERFWIEKFDTFRNGYNLTLGGDGVAGAYKSKRIKEILSQMMKDLYERFPEEKMSRLKNAHAKLHDPEYRKINSQRMKKLMSDDKMRQQISEKVKEKMAQLPTDVKEKIRQHQFKEGHEAWNKGIETPEEVRKKISESEKGRIAWNRGIPMSEEQKRKLSESKKGVPAWNKGKTVETFVCPVCGKEIAWSSMSKHMRARHKSSEEDIKEFLNFARKSKV